MTTIVTRAGKGSALTWTEGDSNFTNLNTAKLENVVEDTTPQLGGNLDVNGNSIVSASNGNINITPNGTGSVVIDGNAHPQTQALETQTLVANGTGTLEWKYPEKIMAYVYNADSVTINKGDPVYVFSAIGDQISVKLALNTGDATSAQTLGLANESIATTASGYVVCQGPLTNIDTSTPGYTAGQALYLGSTAGSKTTTKPYAPNHLVYLGFVEKVNASSGRIYVRTQNGYELEEIHDVNINHNVAIADNQYLQYNSSNGLWENNALDIVNDTSPQLGGHLDVNGKDITSASNGNINIAPNGSGNIALTPTTGKIILGALDWPTSTGTNGQVLTTNGSSAASWTTISSGGLGNIVEDLTPQLGGDLDVNGKAIVSVSNGNIRVEPNGSGNIALTPTTGKIILGALDFPTGTGTNGQVLTTNGSSAMTWTTVSGGLTDVVNDTTPQLGGNLDVNGNSIVSASNANITIAPDGTGDVYLNTDTVRIGDANANATLTTNGTGDLILSTNSGTNSGTIQIYDGTNGNIAITPNGSGNIQLTPTSGVITLGALNWPTSTGTNGQVLTTNGSSAATWTTISAGGGAQSAFVYVSNPKGTLVSGTTYRASIEEWWDPSGIISVASNTVTCASAGTYVIEMDNVEYVTNANTWQHNVFNNGSTGDWVDNTGASFNGDNYPARSYLVATGTTYKFSQRWTHIWRSTISNATFQLRYLLNSTGDTVNTDFNVKIKITKL